MLDATVLFVVAAMSLLLLHYVAHGDARRTAESYQIEKLTAQGQIAQAAIEAFIRPGLPLRHFVGFVQLGETIIASDPLVAFVAVTDANGQSIFAVGDASSITESSVRATAVTRETIHVVVPLRDRFEAVGSLVLLTPRARLAAQVEAAFHPLLLAVLGLAAAFAILSLAVPARAESRTRNRMIGAGFAVVFASFAAAVVVVLLGVYSDGAQSRAKALADSLGQRLQDIVSYDIAFSDILGLDELFAEYRRVNPDIRAAGLVVDDRVVAHTDTSVVGRGWERRTSDYEYAVDLGGNGEGTRVTVLVALPQDVVFSRVLRSAKNFAALFVACGLIAALMMGLVHALEAKARRARLNCEPTSGALTIALVKPAFFLAVFAEHLSYAFLPELVQASTASAGLPASYASAPFVGYYLAFVLALVPAGRLEARISARGVMVAGLVLAAVGLALLASSTEYWTLLVARCLAGAGQGALFVGVQAFALSKAGATQRARAGSMIVFGFQAGMIAGISVGSLLVSSIDARGVFELSAAVAAACAAYVLLALPKVATTAATKDRLSFPQAVTAVMRDGGFARSVILVGIPAKAVMTGVVLFGVPLMLANLHYAKEDIGQITMLYAGAVILTAALAAKLAESGVGTRDVIGRGLLLTGVGLAVLSAPAVTTQFDLTVPNWFVTAAIVLGVVVIGLAHGYINAPIVGHIVESDVSGRVGATTVAATYRLLERAGHVLGPALMVQLFLFAGQGWAVFATIGLGIIAFGGIWLMAERSRAARSAGNEPSARAA